VITENAANFPYHKFTLRRNLLHYPHPLQSVCHHFINPFTVAQTLSLALFTWK